MGLIRATKIIRGRVKRKKFFREITYAKKSDFSDAKTIKITKAATVSKTIASLTKGKKYYVKVRAYKTVSKTKYYSAWSAKKSVTVKK